jgi:hypothetical protein
MCDVPHEPFSALTLSSSPLPDCMQGLDERTFVAYQMVVLVVSPEGIRCVCEGLERCLW